MPYEVIIIPDVTIDNSTKTIMIDASAETGIDPNDSAKRYFKITPETYPPSDTPPPYHVCNKVMFFFGETESTMVYQGEVVGQYLTTQTFQPFYKYGLEAGKTYYYRLKYFSGTTMLGSISSTVVTTSASPPAVETLTYHVWQDGATLYWVCHPTGAVDNYVVELRRNDDTLISQRIITNTGKLLESVTFSNSLLPSSFAMFVWAEKGGLYSQGWGWYNLEKKCILSTPTNLTYQPLTNSITFNCNDYYGIIEYERINQTSPYNLPKYVRDYFYDVALGTSEFNAEGGLRNLHKWRQTDITFSVTFKSSVNSSLRTVIDEYYDDWATDIYNKTNGRLNPIRVSSGGDIESFVGLLSELEGNTKGSHIPVGGYSAYYYYYTDSSGAITSAETYVTTDVFPNEVKRLVFEEMTQALGLGNDTWDYPESLFFDGGHARLESLNYLDGSLVNFMYKPEIPINANNQQLANLINCHCVLNDESYSVYKEIQLSNLINGEQYRVRAWTVDENVEYISPPTDWITFTYVGDGFAWANPVEQGEPITNITKAEWKRFQNAINEKRVKLGHSAFPFYSTFQNNTSFTDPTKNTDNVFRAYYFNQAYVAIGLMSTNGLPSQKYPENQMLASDFNQLVTCLNNL